MCAKSDRKTNSVPLSEEDLTPSSSITYNNEVVAIIAGLAANEIEGIAGMCSVSGNIMSKNRNITKGVKVEVGAEEVAIDLYVIVEYGIPIPRAAADAQENVRKAIESMTGLHVVRVDVHVESVSFEQEKKALQAGAQNAALASGRAESETGKAESNPEESASPEQTAAEEKAEAAETSEAAAAAEGTDSPADQPAETAEPISSETEESVSSDPVVSQVEEELDIAWEGSKEDDDGAVSAIEIEDLSEEAETVPEKETTPEEEEQP